MTCKEQARKLGVSLLQGELEPLRKQAASATATAEKATSDNAALAHEQDAAKQQLEALQVGRVVEVFFWGCNAIMWCPPIRRLGGHVVVGLPTTWHTSHAESCLRFEV